MSYYIHKDNNTKEIIYIDYDKIQGYPVKPKTDILDAISVNKIIFTSENFSKKIIRKKIEIRLRYLQKFLESLDTEEGSNTSEGQIDRTIMDAERLRINIINYYVKYLGNTYGSYCLDEINRIVRALKIGVLEKKIMKENYMNNLYYLDDYEKKGRGR